MAIHPTTGQFVQRDPAGYVDGMNGYGYEEGRPTDREDPLGLAAQEPWSAWTTFGTPEVAQGRWNPVRAENVVDPHPALICPTGYSQEGDVVYADKTVDSDPDTVMVIRFTPVPTPITRPPGYNIQRGMEYEFQSVSQRQYEIKTDSVTITSGTITCVCDKDKKDRREVTVPVRWKFSGDQRVTLTVSTQERHRRMQP